jgi:hypothetical protein
MKMRKVGWFLRMELNIKEIGDRNSVAYGIFKLWHLVNARNFADGARKPILVILGDDEFFWVVSLALREGLSKRI